MRTRQALLLAFGGLVCCVLRTGCLDSLRIRFEYKVADTSSKLPGLPNHDAVQSSQLTQDLVSGAELESNISETQVSLVVQEPLPPLELHRTPTIQRSLLSRLTPSPSPPLRRSTSALCLSTVETPRETPVRARTLSLSLLTPPDSDPSRTPSFKLPQPDFDEPSSPVVTRSSRGNTLPPLRNPKPAARAVLSPNFSLAEKTLLPVGRDLFLGPVPKQSRAEGSPRQCQGKTKGSSFQAQCGSYAAAGSPDFKGFCRHHTPKSSPLSKSPPASSGAELFNPSSSKLLIVTSQNPSRQVEGEIALESPEPVTPPYSASNQRRRLSLPLSPPDSAPPATVDAVIVLWPLPDLDEDAPSEFSSQENTSKHYEQYFDEHPHTRNDRRKYKYPPKDFGISEWAKLASAYIPRTPCSVGQHKLMEKLLEKPRVIEGYIYAFEIMNMGTRDHRYIKVGNSQEPFVRVGNWKRCENKIVITRIWGRSGDPEGGSPLNKPMRCCAYVEAIVHKELKDLAHHTGYIEGQTGRAVDQSEVKCPGKRCWTQHREIFAFKRHGGAELRILDEIVKRWITYTERHCEDTQRGVN